VHPNKNCDASGLYAMVIATAQPATAQESRQVQWLS